MIDELDSAAVFACAMSLHSACIQQAEREPDLCLSDAYNGMDQFMREVMRVGELFEKWNCAHVAFEELVDVWPYLLEERFGAACLEVMGADLFAGFDQADCLRVAFKLRIPLHADGAIPVPVCEEFPNPNAGAGFARLRIQTVREELVEAGQVTPFTEADEPFDEYFGSPFFGIFGVGNDGLLEAIADRPSYESARALLLNLIPELLLPERVIAFQTTNFTNGSEAAGSA